MKKLVIAAAVALISSVAAAQSVQVYGVVDTAIRQDSKANAAGQDKNQMISGGQSTSRFGFKGVEDLGNGLSAKFVLESGFNPTSGTPSQNGATGVVLFDRFAYVALADKKAGELQFGRNTTATYDFAAGGITDPIKLFGDGASTPVTVSNSTYGYKALRINQANTFASTSGYHGSRADSMIKYINSFGPVNAIIGYAPGGVTGSDSLKSTLTYGANAKFGDFGGGAARTRSVDAASKEAVTTAYGASYTLGNATATVGYHTMSTDAGFVASALTITGDYRGPVLGTTTTSGPSTDAKLKVAGLKYNFTPTFATTLAYNDGNYKNGAGKEGTLKSYVLLNEYYLSKRTNLYGSVDMTRADGDLKSASASASNTGIMVGVRHTF